MSIPVKPINDSLSLIMQGCNYTRVWQYQEDQSWKSTETGLETMDHLHGYWIDRTGFNDTCTLTIEGTHPGENEIPLTDEWTLVGFPGRDERPLTGTINQTLYDRIWEYQEDQSWKSTDTGLEEFRPGMGYWIDGTSGGAYNVTY